MSQPGDTESAPSPRSRQDVEAALKAVLAGEVKGPAEHLKTIQNVLEEAVFSRQRRGE